MSARVRVYAVVAAMALAAGALAAGVVLLARDGADAAGEPPPLLLDLGVRDDAEARALRRAQRLYERGDLTRARGIFDRYASPEARVGAALARWPEETLERLEPVAGTGVGRLHTGLALAALGRDGDARAALRAVERIAPDSRYAIRAADLLHPRFVPGLPFFAPSSPPRGALARGLELQRLGRPVSARRTLEAAARRAPDDPEVLTAAAVAAFDKDRPAVAFARLGPLTRRFPRAQTVRFHLGVLLLWIGDVEDARAQLRRARALGPQTRLGRAAARFLERL